MIPIGFIKTLSEIYRAEQINIPFIDAIQSKGTAQIHGPIQPSGTVLSGKMTLKTYYSGPARAYTIDNRQ